VSPQIGKEESPSTSNKRDPPIANTEESPSTSNKRDPPIANTEESPSTSNTPKGIIHLKKPIANTAPRGIDLDMKRSSEEGKRDSPIANTAYVSDSATTKSFMESARWKAFEVKIKEGLQL